MLTFVLPAVRGNGLVQGSPRPFSHASDQPVLRVVMPRLAVWPCQSSPASMDRAAAACSPAPGTELKGPPAGRAPTCSCECTRTGRAGATAAARVVRTSGEGSMGAPVGRKVLNLCPFADWEAYSAVAPPLDPASRGAPIPQVRATVLPPRLCGSYRLLRAAIPGVTQTGPHILFGVPVTWP